MMRPGEYEGEFPCEPSLCAFCFASQPDLLRQLTLRRRAPGLRDSCRRVRKSWRRARRSVRPARPTWPASAPACRADAVDRCSVSKPTRRSSRPLARARSASSVPLTTHNRAEKSRRENGALGFKAPRLVENGVSPARVSRAASRSYCYSPQGIACFRRGIPGLPWCC